MVEAGHPKARRILFFDAYRYAFSIADQNQDRLIAPTELITANVEN